MHVLRPADPRDGRSEHHRLEYATSRAGDPSPHHHVLVANLIEMLDVEGGWKAADTTLWREHLHAATNCVPLLGVRGARERTYATAAALATEAAVAELVARGTGVTGAAAVPSELVETAITRAEHVLDRPLTSGQATAVRGICGEGRRISLVLGVAGAGKTTAIRCTAEAYTAAGYEVVGTATSGQAARTLGREADLTQSRTVQPPSHGIELDFGALTARRTLCPRPPISRISPPGANGPTGPGGRVVRTVGCGRRGGGEGRDVDRSPATKRPGAPSGVVRPAGRSRSR